MNTPRHCDVAVVGLGAMGAATLFQLAKRGVRVLGIDRFAPPHAHGSTHGETRITRQGIGEGASFAPLALRSHAIWREIEAATGAALLQQCGGIVIAGAGRASEMHGQRDFLGTSVAAARQFGIPHERLDAGEIARRFPAFRLTGDEIAYYEPGAGYLLPEACVAAQLALAAQYGARLMRDTRVDAVEPRGPSARIVCNGTVIEAGTVVLAAGAWMPQLLPALAPRLVVSRQVLTWFAHDGGVNYRPDAMPVFIWHWGADAESVCYGFPQTDAQMHIKVGTEQRIASTDPDRVARDVPAAESAAIYDRHLRSRLRGLMPVCTRTATCLYTSTPDARFLIGRVPDAPQLIAVSACSGHGFKHSAAIGEAVADMIVSGTTPAALAPFAW